MSATMARLGGWVQLEQSDMRLALNMAKIAKGGFSHAAIEETQQLFKKPCDEVREEKKRGVQLPGHKYGKAAVERHAVMICEYLTDDCQPCQNFTATNPQSCWRHKGPGAIPSQPAPPPPGLPAVPPSDIARRQTTEIDGAHPGYVYIHTSLSNTPFFNYDPYDKDRKPNKDFIPDLLTD